MARLPIERRRPSIAALFSTILVVAGLTGCGPDENDGGVGPHGDGGGNDHITTTEGGGDGNRVPRCMGLGGTLSMIMNHACGVLEDRSVACWGSNDSGESSPPAGEFQQVAAGRNHSCGIKVDGSIACWGWNVSGQSTPPPGTFTQISAGGNHTCAISTDGSLICWGTITKVPIAGPFRLVSAGSHFTCVVRTDGSVGCWAGNENLIASPNGTFKQISVGYLPEACAVNDDGSVVCWNSASTDVIRASSAPFTEVGKFVHACGLTSEGQVICWGDDGMGGITPPSGAFIHVVVGNTRSCAMKEDGFVICWPNVIGTPMPPATPFLRLGPDGRPCQ